MPIYEYQCVKCGKPFEHLARTLNEAAPNCPSCGAGKPEKLLSSFSAIGGHADDSPCEACPSCPTCPTGPCSDGSCPLG